MPTVPSFTEEKAGCLHEWEACSFLKQKDEGWKGREVEREKETV